MMNNQRLMTMIGVKMMFTTHKSLKDVIERFKSDMQTNIDDNIENGLNRNIKTYRHITAEEWIEEKLKINKNILQNT